MLRAILFLAVIPSVLLTSSCGGDSEASGTSSLELGRIAWSKTRAAQDAPSREDFVALAGKSLVDLPPFPVADAGPKLDLQGLYDQDDGEALMILTAKVRNDKSAVNIEVKVVATASLSSGFDAEALMKSGFDDLTRALGSMFRIYGGGKAVWLRSLDSAEPDEQILAARMISVNKINEGVEALARLLTDPRETVAEEAATSLSELKDERAVPLIIESIKRGDLRSEVRAIETMAAIGGAEARAYLEMTSVGHEVPEVRKVSADALKRMKSL